MPVNPAPKPSPAWITRGPLSVAVDGLHHWVTSWVRVNVHGRADAYGDYIDFGTRCGLDGLGYVFAFRPRVIGEALPTCPLCWFDYPEGGA